MVCSGRFDLSKMTCETYAPMRLVSPEHQSSEVILLRQFSNGEVVVTKGNMADVVVTKGWEGGHFDMFHVFSLGYHLDLEIANRFPPP